MLGSVVRLPPEGMLGTDDTTDASGAPMRWVTSNDMLNPVDTTKWRLEEWRRLARLSEDERRTELEARTPGQLWVRSIHPAPLEPVHSSAIPVSSSSQSAEPDPHFFRLLHHLLAKSAGEAIKSSRPRRHHR